MTSSTFRLSKSAKRLISLTYDKEQAKVLKEVLIEGQVAEAVARMQKVKQKESEDS